MSSKQLITCGNGHRFPVNRNKNISRDHVFCPRCRDKVTIRGRTWTGPNPDWKDQKLSHRKLMALMKIGKRKPQPAPTITQPILSPIMFKMLAALRRRQESIEPKKEEKVNEQNEE